MTLTVKHSTAAAGGEPADPSLLGSADWNADHTITGTIPNSILDNSSVNISGHALPLGGTLALSSTDISGLGTFATQNYATPPAIGGTTPAAGNFTTLGTSGIANIGGVLTVGAGSGGLGVIANGGVTNATDGGYLGVRNNGANVLFLGNKSAINGGAYDATAEIYSASPPLNFLVGSTATTAQLNGSGTASTSPTTGALVVTGGLGVNGGNIGLSNNQAVLWGSGSDYITGSAAAHSLSLYTNGVNRLGIDQYGQVTMLANVASTSSTTGTLQITGGVGVTGNVVAGGVVYAPTVGTSTVTVAGLPAAGPKAGYRYLVSDATVSTFYSIVIGGGGNVVPVFSDGANWRIG